MLEPLNILIIRKAMFSATRNPIPPPIGTTVERPITDKRIANFCARKQPAGHA